MSIIPKFLLKRIYVSGSLRETSEGIAFDLVNSIGPGILTRLNNIKLNDKVFSPQEILIKIGDKIFKGSEITENNPAIFFHNQKSTCIIMGAKLAQGLHTITVDLLSREAGKVVVTVQDNYGGGGRQLNPQ
jgi:hypothetical protein